MDQNSQSFWSIPAEELLKKLQSTASGLSTNEAMLTGETFPVEKNVSVLPSDTALSHRT